jgi:hypothetical protein
MNRYVFGVAALALLGLAACGPKGANGRPAPYAANAWPADQNSAQNGAPNGAPERAPYDPAQDPSAQNPSPQPGGYPQPGAYPPPQQAQNYPVAGGQAGQPAWGQPQGYPSAQGGGLQVPGAPQGMRPIPSQAGYVFITRLGGSPQASKLLQGLSQGVSTYFDGPPQIIRSQNDPSDRVAVVAFQASLRGQPVLGQMMIATDGSGGGTGFLLFDSADRTPQTMAAMLAAARAGAGN